MDWNDLKVLLAFARHGTLQRAAKTLDTTHTTVSRRLKALEAQVGSRLLERTATGARLTPAGYELAHAATQMETAALAAENRVAGRDARLSGRLRVTTLDAMAAAFAPFFTEFSREHPEVRLEMTVSNAAVSLSRREADVAIRATSSPPEHLVGRKVGRLEYAVYAARSLVESLPENAPLSAFPWIKPQARLGARLTEAWMAEHAPGARVVGEFDTMLSIGAAAEAGMGASLLSCWAGDTSEELVRLTDVLPAMGVDVWVLTHEDLRTAARVRAFTDFMVERVRPLQPVLSGETVRFSAI